MTCVFISNFLTHHQIPFCEQMYKKLNGKFYFISHEPMSKERLSMNWEVERAPYEIRPYESHEEYLRATQLVQEADIAIISHAPNTYLNVKKRLSQNKITFRFSERIFKKKHETAKNVLRAIKHYVKNVGCKNLHLLCASAYAAEDYAKIGVLKNRYYKWGYFPEQKLHENIDALISTKKANSIIWVARFIDWKHPEIPVQIAQRLKNNGYDFQLNMIGNGILKSEIESMVQEKGLADCVHLLGSMQPHEVRAHMEESEIFLFTSDRGEGWGAVLNEAMNSGCAAVASNAIGSAPFLIEDGVNGLLYNDGDLDDLYRKTKALLDDKSKRTFMEKAAYRTIAEEWCAENAAERFVQFSERLLSGQNVSSLFEAGVLSCAEILNSK